METSAGQPYLSLAQNETGTGRVDPFTIPFAGETFRNMVVDGDIVQINGSIRGNAKYLTSFAEKENASLEQRLSDYAKFSDRRIFVSATDGNDGNHGRSWDQAVRTIRRACEIAEPRTTIFVASGDYYEITPIFVKPNVAIIGDSLRNVFLYSKSWEFKKTDENGKGEYATPVNGIDYNRRDYFHLSSNTYLVGLRFKFLESPGYCAAFPAAMVDVSIEDGQVVPPSTVPANWDPEYLPLLYTPDGYFRDNQPITGPYDEWETDGETDSFFQVVLERVHIVNGGSGYSLNSRVDIAPPDAAGGVRALALPEVVSESGALQRIRLFERGRGYIGAYRDLAQKDTLITLSSDGEGGIVRPVFRIDAFRAWFDEGGQRTPAGSVFATQTDHVFESARSYKSLLGTKDADALYPTDPPPSLTLECGLNPRVSNFDDLARDNPGNFRKASLHLSLHRRAVQNHVIQWVDENAPSSLLSSDQRATCRRDVGFLIDAVVSDLFEGGMYESVRAANAYYSRNSDGNFDLIIPEPQRNITANAIREGRDYVLDTVFSNWNPSLEDAESAKNTIESLFSGIANTIEAGITDRDPETIVVNTKRYVAYKLHASNLVKWRLEGRNTTEETWTVLDERDFTFESPDARNRTVTPSFDATAKQNPGGFIVESQTLYAEKTNVQDAVIEHVRTVLRPQLNAKQLSLCHRDAGLIVLAVARDLRVGGYRNAARSAIAYYLGNRSVLPIEQTQPTVDALVYLKERIQHLLPSVASIVGSLIEGITVTIQNPRISIEGRYGIAQPRGFHFYRLVMLQNDEERVDESGTMKLRRLEFFEEAIPDVVVDGPTNDLTIVDFVEITARGSGYDSESPPTVTFEPVNENNPPDVPAQGTALIASNGTLETIVITNTGRGYTEPPNVIIDPPPNGGTQATGFALMGADYARLRVERLDPESGRIDAVRIVSPGSGYEEVPTVSIHAPERIRPVVVASPYVQNCSNISGPWDQRRRRVSEFHPLPYPLEDVYRDGPDDPDRRIVNPLGSAGGIRIDGACPRTQSPLRSFVVDAFTQVNQGGMGFLLVNLAYAQFVSTFGTFCHTHMKALGGSFANASNSVTDFGILGLQARGFWPFPYTRARVVPPGSDPNASTSWSSARGMYLTDSSPPGYYSDLTGLAFVSRGSGFTPQSDVRIRVGEPSTGGVRARVEGETVDGSFRRIDTSTYAEGGQPIEDVRLQPDANLATRFGQGDRFFRGTGYKSAPNIEIQTTGPGEGLELTAILSGVSVVRIQVIEGRRPEILSIARIHGRWYTIESVREAFDAQDREIPGQFDITVSPPVNYAETGFEILMHNVSYLSTGSHVMEYVGSGITYNALPEFGGVPSVSAEIDANTPAKVFFTTSDHRGNSRVGPQFAVDQATGSIALEASQFDLSNINSIGPFVRNGITVGERLREVSNNAQLRSDATGFTDGETVPTQVAVKTYVDRRTVPNVPEDFRTRRYFLQADQLGTEVPGQDFRQSYRWRQLDAEDLTIEEASLRTDVLTGLYVDGNARVYGTHTVGALQIANPEREPPLPNGALTIRIVSDGSDGYKLAFQMSDPEGTGDVFEQTLPLQRKGSSTEETTDSESE